MTTSTSTSVKTGARLIRKAINAYKGQVRTVENTVIVDNWFELGSVADLLSDLTGQDWKAGSRSVAYLEVKKVFNLSQIRECSLAILEDSAEYYTPQLKEVAAKVWENVQNRLVGVTFTNSELIEDTWNFAYQDYLDRRI